MPSQLFRDLEDNCKIVRRATFNGYCKFRRSSSKNALELVQFVFQRTMLRMHEHRIYDTVVFVFSRY